MELLEAAVMGVVEGLTEFLPISSTGHLMLAGSLLNFTGDRVKVFEIAIQTGAMFAVVREYRQRLLAMVRGVTHDPVAQRFARNVIVAFLPAAFFGLLLGGGIKQHLFAPVPVAIAPWWWAASSSSSSRRATSDCGCPGQATSKARARRGWRRSTTCRPPTR
jgi:undecaprenyl-diphosphatase